MKNAAIIFFTIFICASLIYEIFRQQPAVNSFQCRWILFRDPSSFNVHGFGDVYDAANMLNNIETAQGIIVSVKVKCGLKYLSIEDDENGQH